MASKKQKYLESAQRFMLKGQLDKAIKDYQQVVALEPTEIRYRQKLAELLVRDSRRQEAIVQYEDIGKHYADNSYYLKAIAVYKQIQRLSPDNTDVALTLASLNHKQGLIGNAFAEYGQVVARFEKEGAIKEAVKVLEQMLVIDGDHAATRLKRAELLFATGSQDASYEAFSTLLQYLQGRGDDAAAQQVAARMRQLFPESLDGEGDSVADGSSAGEIESYVAGSVTASEDAGDAFGQWEDVDSLELGVDPAEQDAFAVPPSDLPSAFAPASAAVTEPPSAFAEPARPPKDLPSPAPAANKLSSPWEEEIELDLDDDAETVVAATHDEELPLDFLSLDAEDSPAEVATQPDASPSVLPAAPVSHLAEAAPDFDEGASPFEESASPFEEIELSLEVTSPFSEASSPFAEGPSLFSEAPSPFGEAGVPFAEGSSTFADLPPFEELSAFEEAPSPFAETASPFAGTSPAATSPVAAFDEIPSSEGAGSPLDLDLPGGEEFPDIEWAEEVEDLAPANGELEDVLETAGEPADGMEWAEDFEPAEETESAEEVESFEEIEWVDEIESVEEIGAVEEIKAAEEIESVDEIEAAGAGIPRKLRDWQDIYPEAATGEADLDIEELESHYDLGVGYKEMGMYSQAIKEFDVAAANPQRRLDCLTLQAVCYREKGETDKARDLLERGRDLDVLSDGERMAVSYELAYLYESAGAVEQAIGLYREVHRLNPAFHDVGQRLSSLTGEEPLDIIDLDLEEA